MATIKKGKSDAVKQAEAKTKAETDVLVESDEEGGIIYPGGWDEPTPQQKHDLTLQMKLQVNKKGSK